MSVTTAAQELSNLLVSPLSFCTCLPGLTSLKGGRQGDQCLYHQKERSRNSWQTALITSTLYFLCLFLCKSRDLIIVIVSILFSSLLFKILVHHKLGLISLNIFDTKAAVSGCVDRVQEHLARVAKGS